MGGLGELWVRGPGVLTGYWNAPAATEAAVTEDGWLRTGDLVRVGPLGTVMFCGRRKHTVKSGGYSVYPLEVETLLEEHPDVVTAFVKVTGEATAAYRANPDAWNAASPEAEKIARLTGAKQDEVPALLKGYIFPTLRKTGLNRIVLVRDNMECCFGPGAALFDCILVTMAPGKTAEYSIRPVAVEGTIRLEELQGGPDGRPLAIYQMVGEKVE